ncbi:MAG: azurin [Polaribacter sp.]|jgi:azurin|tara:strand:+ start:41 stop:586 length:546 start_codon:yes stop_codon:yes gene_type:complete
MKNLKKMKSILTAIICLTLLVSCGKSKEEKASQKAKTTVVTKAKVAAKKEMIVVDSDGVVNVTMITNDRMKFNLNKITVKAGQKIKLTLTHTGKLNKRIMGHNVVFLNKGTELSTFASKAAAAKENDYIPVGSSAVLAHTKMLGGGETTTIEFTAPEAGTYDYICSFPAHYALMKGKLIVE